MTEEQAYEKRWWVLAVLVIGVMVVSLDNTILNVALPRIQEALGATQSQQEWIVDSYLLVFAGSLLTLGAFGDRYGRRRMLVIGLAIFGVGSLASTFATSASQLIATRGLMGVGGAAIMPASLAIITRVFPEQERGRAIGLWAGIVGVSIGLGPLVGGFLLEHFWWGSVFFINVPIVIFSLVAIPLLVPESKSAEVIKADPLGVVLSISGLSAFVYGVIQGGELATVQDVHVLGPLVVGVVLLAQFVVHELHTAQPMIDLTIFRIRAFSASALAVSLVFFAMLGATFFLTFYLQFVRGLSSLRTGAMLMPMALAMSFFAPRSARFVQRFGTRSVSAFGMTLVGVSFLSYVFVGVTSSYWLVGVILLLVGSGMGIAMAPATTAIMNALPIDRAGSGSAINNTTRQVGGALGVAVLGSLLSAEYRTRVAHALQGLPVGLRDKAGESIGATLAIAHSAGPAGTSLIAPAKLAFVDAFHVATLGSAASAFLGALVLLRFLPKTLRKPAPAVLPRQRTAVEAGALATTLIEV